MVAELLRGAPVFTRGPAVIFAHSGRGRVLRMRGTDLGAAQAAIAVGRRLEAVAAIDFDEGGLEVHKANFETKHVLHGGASSLVDFHVSGSGQDSSFAYAPEILDAALAKEVGKVDLFLAGPPCQGHSNLNNKTTARSPRNLLYLTAVALAVGLEADMVVIENVPEVVNDRSEVVTVGKALFKGSVTSSWTVEFCGP